MVTVCECVHFLLLPLLPYSIYNNNNGDSDRLNYCVNLTETSATYRSSSPTLIALVEGTRQSTPTSTVSM